ncbi:MAG: isocitrate lyase/PEP mutase family protein [Lachnospiraceae bacterium]|nr:isocitrate lyase/PEP mutase family protein [Lachnospiraceae bacterium]
MRLKELIEKGQIVVPGIYDCISARAVELTGFQACFLSDTGVSYSWCGVPDLGLVNAEEMLWFVSRITDYVDLPVVVSAGHGYDGTGSAVYRTVKRMAKAGAAAVLIDDGGSCHGSDRTGSQEVVSQTAWKNKILAAKMAAEGTDCLVIALSMAKDILGFDEAIRRSQMAYDLGVDMVSISGLRTLEDAKFMTHSVPGRKLWMDWDTDSGAFSPDLEELGRQGFCMVTIFYTEEASMYGMLDFAKQNLKNGNTVYHDQHDFDGLLKPGEDYHKFFSFHKKWLPMEERFLDVKELSRLPDFVKE